MDQRLRGWLFDVAPAPVFVVLLFVGGSLEPGPKAAPVNDKVLHLAAFAVLTVLVYRALGALGPRRRLRALLLSGAAIAVAVGVLLELWQLALPYRSAEMADVAADAIGALIAVAGIFAYRRRGRARVTSS